LKIRINFFNSGKLIKKFIRYRQKGYPFSIFQITTKLKKKGFI